MSRVKFKVDGDFGERLMEFRYKRGLTQKELSEKAGLNHNQVSRLENGVTDSPLPSTIRKLAEALDIEPIELFR